MRKLVVASCALLALGALGGCGKNKVGGVMSARSGLDEYAVARRAPLVVPPDFNLVPPRPGEARPQEADTSTQALSAMFGGPATASQGEAAVTAQAGRAADPGIRSTAGSPDTNVVDKGAVTKDILNAPATTPGTPIAAGTPSPVATPTTQGPVGQPGPSTPQ